MHVVLSNESIFVSYGIYQLNVHLITESCIPKLYVIQIIYFTDDIIERILMTGKNNLVDLNLKQRWPSWMTHICATKVNELKRILFAR